MTFQACQIVANFTTDWELSLDLAHMNATMRSRKLEMLVHMDFTTSKRGWLVGFL